MASEREQAAILYDYYEGTGGGEAALDAARDLVAQELLGMVTITEADFGEASSKGILTTRPEALVRILGYVKHAYLNEGVLPTGNHYAHAFRRRLRV